MHANPERIKLINELIDAVRNLDHAFGAEAALAEVATVLLLAAAQNVGVMDLRPHGMGICYLEASRHAMERTEVTAQLLSRRAHPS